ncbi:MAG: hypothetical protein QXL89_03680 [Nitrososphaeria archaeon]
MSDKVDRIILDAIDESLSVLGEKGKESIYYFLEKEYLIEQEDIPSNLKAFHECLHLVFGVGANVLEKHIINNLKKKVNVKIRTDDFSDFVETIEKIKKAIKEKDFNS